MTTNTPEALLPCPLATEEPHQVELCSIPSNHPVFNDVYYVYCSCGLCGTITNTAEEAAKKWNTRRPLPAERGDAKPTKAEIDAAFAESLPEAIAESKRRAERGDAGRNGIQKADLSTIDREAQPNLYRLCERINEEIDKGLVDVKAFPMPGATTEEAAASILALMDAPRVYEIPESWPCSTVAEAMEAAFLVASRSDGEDTWLNAKTVQSAMERLVASDVAAWVAQGEGVAWHCPDCECFSFSEIKRPHDWFREGRYQECKGIPLALGVLASPAATRATGSECEAELTRLRELEARVNSPETLDFLEGVRLEAVHQQERWGTDGDKGKTPEDWMWLVAFLSTKATQAARYKDRPKYLHHIITTAAVLLNWHAYALGNDTGFNPGAPDPEVNPKPREMTHPQHPSTPTEQP
jgi:hypothetical protein